MNCPVCNTELRIAERQGIEIDHCPSCRGIWLDRGELDKIIERSATYAAQPEPRAPDNRDRPAEYRERSPEYRDRERRDHDRYDDDDDHYKRRKKKGFLGDLFDFD
jgi:uncharacterized protein